MVSEKSKIGSNCGKRRRMEKHVYSSFPVDVIFSILLYLPSDILNNVMKFVCKEWYEVIKSPIFISSHLEKQSNTNSLLIHHGRIGCWFVGKLRCDGNVVDIEVKKLNFQFLENAWAICNGLIFVMGPKERVSKCPCFIVNPLTKDYLPLPLYPGPLMQHGCGFGYVAASKVYKVMRLSFNESKFHILSVGVDKAWRKVDAMKQLHCYKEVKNLIVHLHQRCCVTLKGCMYWFLKSFPHLLCFDMEKESFNEIPFSPPYDISSRGLISYGLLEMQKENSLCLWVKKWTEEKYLYEFWLLKDPETVVFRDGQWEKLLDLYMEDDYKDYRPIAWLKSTNLLVFSGGTKRIVYNINTQKVYPIKDLKGYIMYYSEHYVESLVPLNNLSLVTRHGQPFKPRRKVYSKENILTY